MRVYLALLTFACGCPQADGSVMQYSNGNIEAVRIFPREYFEGTKSARIFSNRIRQYGRNINEVEVCYVYGDESVAKLVFILSRLSGYKVPDDTYRGLWRRSVKTDKGDIIQISNDWNEKFPQIFLKAEWGVYVVSPDSEPRIRAFFDCTNSF